MRGIEIIRELGNVPDHVAKAILNLDARAHQGNGGPKALNSLEVHHRLTQAINRKGGVGAAAKAWAVSRQHVYDVLNDTRPPGPALQHALGIRRRHAGRTMYEIVA